MTVRNPKAVYACVNMNEAYAPREIGNMAVCIDGDIGDVSISRLGRSAKDLLNIIDTLTDKKVTLISHKEKIDTDTPTGKFMLTVFAALSQLEREQLKQRQREGIEIAKAQGKYKGRKPIPIDWDKFSNLYGEWKSKSITGRDFMRRMGLTANTFYRRVCEYEAAHHITEQTTA